MNKSNLPAPLRAIPAWTTSEGKKPRWLGPRDYFTGKPSGDSGLVYEDLPNDGTNRGVFVTLKNDLVVLDFDCCTNIPENLPPTYTEWSQSGYGVHLFYRSDTTKPDVPNISGCTTFRDGDYTWAAKRALGSDDTKTMQVEIYFNKRFVLVTGKEHPRSTPGLALIDLRWLLRCFGVEKSAEVVMDVLPAVSTLEAREAEATRGLDPDWLSYRPNLERLLRMLPLAAERNGRVQAAYARLRGEDYSHYNYWLFMAFALHDATSGSDDGLRLFIEWSRRDPVAFQSEQDCTEKWASIGPTRAGHAVTRATLLAMFRLAWFAPTALKRDNAADVVDNQNAYAFAAAFHLAALRSGNHYFLTGYPLLFETVNSMRGRLSEQTFLGIPEVYGPFSGPTLPYLYPDIVKQAMYPFYNPFSKRVYDDLGTSVRTAAEAAGVEEKSIFGRWVDSAPAKPGHDLRALFDCLILSSYMDKELAWEYFRAHFFNFALLHSGEKTRYEECTGVLILMGGEGGGKTSFFKQLVPQEAYGVFLSAMSSRGSSEKQMRDFLRTLACAPLLLIDEFDGFMGKESEFSSFFKNAITSGTVEYVEPYSKEITQRPRQAVVFGTTNRANFRMSDDGTRRFLVISVQDEADENGVPRPCVDWKKYNALDKRSVFRSVFDEFRAIRASDPTATPWVLSSDTRSKQTEMNDDFSTPSEAMSLLQEFFPIVPGVDRSYLYDLKDLRKSSMVLRASDVLELMNRPSGVKLGAMKHALVQYSRQYVSGMDRKKFHIPPVPGRPGVFPYAGSFYYAVPMSPDEIANGEYENFSLKIGKR